MPTPDETPKWTMVWPWLGYFGLAFFIGSLFPPLFAIIGGFVARYVCEKGDACRGVSWGLFGAAALASYLLFVAKVPPYWALPFG